MPFWRFSRSTLIISVNSIYWLVFVVETEFSVRHKLTLYIYNLGGKKTVPLPVRGGQTGSGTGFCSSTSVSSHHHHSTQLHTHFHPNTTRIRRTEERCPRKLKRSNTLSSIWSKWKGKVLPLFSVIHWKANEWSLGTFQQRWCSGVSWRASRKKITFSL